ncbi:MAG: DUF2489 domain-containing protein [Deltaproteobacteria bacterium]|nr:DUF2489 domain-containing protein [Deltaproteobacteria bacterium]
MTDVPPTIRMRLCIEDVLRSRLPLFDGVEALLGIAGEVPQLAHDRDLRTLTQLLTQAEHLPVGKERARWNAEALHRVDRELMELERRHQDAVFYGCRRLLQTLDAIPG